MALREAKRQLPRGESLSRKQISVRMLRPVAGSRDLRRDLRICCGELGVTALNLTRGSNLSSALAHGKPVLLHTETSSWYLSRRLVGSDQLELLRAHLAIVGRTGREKGPATLCKRRKVNHSSFEGRGLSCRQRQAGCGPRGERPTPRAAERPGARCLISRPRFYRRNGSSPAQLTGFWRDQTGNLNGSAASAGCHDNWSAQINK